jgi:hypothetical protein
MKAFHTAFSHLLPIPFRRKLGIDLLEVAKRMNRTEGREHVLGVLQVTTLSDDDQIAFFDINLFLNAALSELVTDDWNRTSGQDISLEKVRSSMIDPHRIHPVYSSSV